MVDKTCGQAGETVNSISISSKIRSGWHICVGFSSGSCEMYFHVQIKQSCKSENLARGSVFLV